MSSGERFEKQQEEYLFRALEEEILGRWAGF